MAQASSMFVFAGENAYMLREERRRWRAEFIAKHGEQNVSVLDGRELVFRDLLSEAATLPFLGSKRLIVIEGIPKFEKSDIQLLARSMAGSSILVFVVPAPDRRRAGVKALLEHATVRNFAPLRGAVLSSWVRDYSRTLSSSIEAEGIAALLERVGTDQDALARELEKLALAAGEGPITTAHIEELAVPSREQEGWQLTRLLMTGNWEKSIAFTHSLLERGEDPASLWHMLLWTLRALVCVAAAVSEGERNPSAIAKVHGLPFPTVQMLLAPASLLDRRELCSLVSWAAEADIACKTGVLRSSQEAPHEMAALLETFLHRAGKMFSSSR